MQKPKVQSGLQQTRDAWADTAVSNVEPVRLIGTKQKLPDSKGQRIIAALNGAAFGTFQLQLFQLDQRQ